MAFEYRHYTSNSEMDGTVKLVLRRRVSIFQINVNFEDERFLPYFFLYMFIDPLVKHYYRDKNTEGKIMEKN